MKSFVSIGLAITSLLGQPIYADSVSLRDKIGQMLVMGFEGKSIDARSPIVQEIQQDNIGGVVLFDTHTRNLTPDKNIQSPEQLRQLNHNLQAFTQVANIIYHRPNLPLLISTDYEGGKVTRLKESYGFPKTLSAAEIGTLTLSEVDLQAKKMAQTMRSVGINLNLAPVVDLNINPSNPIIAAKERSFSNNPNDVANDAHLFAQNDLAEHIQCAYKHFPGHGSSKNDTHLGFVDITNDWQSDELLPYQMLLNQSDQCGMVMAGHLVNRQLDDSGLPASLSYKMLTGILRQQLHFSGVIITDDMQMKAITDHYNLKQALTLSINAGTDMFIFGNQLDNRQEPKELIDIIESEVHAGHIKASRIEDAYAKIIALKQTL